MPGVALTLSGLYGAEVSGGLSLRAPWVLAGLGMAALGALAASAQAVWRLWRLPILAAAHPRAWARASLRALRLQGAVALALLAAAGLLAAFGDGLYAGFALLGALILGAALGLPILLWAVLGLAARAARGVVSEWFLADTRQQLSGLSLALMALMLALTANIGVGTMVGSFRQTFEGWLDQRLAAELYVTAATPEEGERLDGVPGAPHPGHPAHRLGRDAHRRPPGGRLRRRGPSRPTARTGRCSSAVPGVWDRLAAGEGALLNEQTARRLGLGVGDRLALAAGWEAEILAVYSDYGNPAGQAIVSLDALDARFPGLPRQRFGLRVAEDDAPALIEAITGEFGLPRENIIDQASAKALSLRVFDQTFRVTGALNVLTFGVAGFAMLTSFLTLASMRLPQLAPVWALGLTRARLARLEMARTLLLARADGGGGASRWGSCWPGRCSPSSTSRPSAGACRWRSSRSNGCGSWRWRCWPPGSRRSSPPGGWPPRPPARCCRSSPMNARTLLPALLLALLLPLRAAAQGLYGLGTEAEGFAVPQPEPRFEFPADHGPHPGYRIEWWYVTANLTGEDGRDYGMQWTLFRTALAPGDDGSAWTTPQLWMGHMGLTTPERHYHAERMARGGTGQAGVVAEPFRAWIDEWSMEGPTPAEVRLTAAGDEVAYDLRLEATGPFVPQGEGGYSVKSATGQASYYYSQPFYEVEGTLTLPEGEVRVTGTGWMDREWSSQYLAESQTGWDWFSLAFESGERMMAFRLRDSERGDFVPATWIAADGTPTPYGDGAATVTPLATREVAGRAIPVRWRVTLPDRGLDVTTEPVNHESWMGTSFPYWEGPIRVSGTHEGVGYLEMTGYEPEQAPGG